MKLKAVPLRMKLDTLILLLIFLQITLFSWLDIRGIGNRLIVGIIIIHMFIISGLMRYQLRSVALFLIIVILFSISAFNGQSFSFSIYYGNLRALVYPIVPLMYIAWLAKYKRNYLHNLFENCFSFFNWFYVINYLIMLAQGMIPGFLAGLSDHVNYYTPDLMSGLFGYEGTAQFGMYSIFILLYDFYSFKYSEKYRINSKFKRNVCQLILTASVVVSSVLNDNKAIFIALVILFFEYYLISSSNKKFSGRLLAMSWIVVGCIVIFIVVVYAMSTNLQFFYNISSETGGTVYLLRKLLFDVSSYQSGEVGSIERVYMLIYVYFHPEYVLFGAGTAFSYWQTPGTLGFSHFGQSDMSSFLCLGGILFCSACFMVYFYYYRCITGKTKHNVNICFAAHIICVLFYYFYTQPWTQSTLSICIACMFIPLGMLTDKVNMER